MSSTKYIHIYIATGMSNSCHVLQLAIVSVTITMADTGYGPVASVCCASRIADVHIDTRDDEI
jgi:hypothetical protein